MPPKAMKRPAAKSAATERKQPKTQSGATELTVLQGGATETPVSASSAVKGPAAFAAFLQGGANEPRVLESRNAEVPGNAGSENVDIHALFLAATESQDRRDVALCEQVYKLKRFPLQLNSTGSMALCKERKSEDSLRQKIKRRMSTMSKECQEFLSAMKLLTSDRRDRAIELASYSSASASSLKGRRKQIAWWGFRIN